MHGVFLLKETRHDLEWLHHPFSFRMSVEREVHAKVSCRDAEIVDADEAQYVNVDFRRFYEAEPMEQVCIVKRGVNARLVDVLAALMQIPRDKLIGTLGLVRATIQRKSRLQALLSSDESSRIMGVGRLIGQAQAMLDESGAAVGFNTAAWMGRWLDQPLPALNRQRPGDLMDTAEGQFMVSLLLSQIQSGAYA